MKTTKIIITCDLCGKEIAENEAATLTLPEGATYDICPKCAERILTTYLPAPAEEDAPPEERFLRRAQLGAKCEAVRKKLKLTQKEYAQKLGICTTSIVRLEHNRGGQIVKLNMKRAVAQIEADYDWHCC